MKNDLHLIFLVGLEGTGHHLYLDACNYQETEPLHGLLLNYFDVFTYLGPKEDLKQSIYKRTQSLVASGKNHLDRASFPCFRPPIMSYDILEFYELFSSMPHVKLFFIVNVRNIIYSTLSAHNRFDKDKSIVWSARLQENYLIYINSQIQLLPKDKYLIIDLNDLCNNVGKFEEILREKSGMNDISFDRDKIKIPDNSKHLKNEHYDYLTSYFNETRLKQFSFLESNKLKF